MLPLDGSIAEHVPAIAAAYARLVPVKEWPSITVADLTSGSCLLPLVFAACGARRLIVNDIAERSELAARALFGGRTLSWPLVRQLVTARRPRLARHVPSFHFAADYLLEPVAEIFDRLYFARQGTAYQYLALRWVLGFAPEDTAWNILPTHDRRQLRDDLTSDWEPYLRRTQAPLAVLKRLVDDINAATVLVAHTRVSVHRQDMLSLAPRLDYGRRALVVGNPPTRGLDEYVIDDQLAHSLMANRWLPLSRSRESAETFWTRRVNAVLAAVPTGSHAVVWGGDGSMRWEECRRVWARWGTLVAHRRVGRAGWAILERR
jgi:hypothetical protein